MPHDSLSQSPRAKKPGLQGLNTWTWWMLSSMDIITNHHNKPQNHRVVGGKGHFLTLAFNSSFTQWNNKTLRRRFEKWIKLKSCEKKWPRKCHNESMKSIHFIHLAPPKSFKFKLACEGEEVQRYISLKGVSLNVRGLFYKASSWSLALINTDQVWCSWQTAPLHLLSLSSSFFNKLETYRF